MERKNAWSQYSAEELSRLEAVRQSGNVYVLRLKELKKKGIRT